jgi:UDP-2-acetamido-2-deoxy-ribo-hexuluronate aminotransferase
MIKYVSLDRLYNSYRQDLLSMLDSMYSTGQVKNGKYSRLVEEYLQDYLGVDNVLFTTSGTTAITISLIALGVKPGDEIITSNYSYVASANQINLLGATPVFVDVNEQGNINEHAIQDVITDKTKAILPVSLFGNTPDYEKLQSYDIPLLCDCAQSLGADYKNIKDGTFGEYNTFSFATNKPVPTLGTAGAIATNLDKKDIKIIANCGKSSRNAEISHLGVNGEPTEEKAIQVYLGLHKMQEWQDRRTEISKYFAECCEDNIIALNGQSNWHKFVIKTKDREDFQNYFIKQGIETQIHYTENFNKSILGNKQGIFRQTEKLKNSVVSIPNHQFLNDNEVEKIAGALREYYGQV